ncbi:MAG: hypothetical protein II839_05320, partial [Kiritimatiellae bacterium]|nr:hypothetical protein [Kiritimatiellia bacterium]
MENGKGTNGAKGYQNRAREGSFFSGRALRHNSCYPNRDGELLGCATIGVTENCGAMNMTNDEKKTNHRLMRR